GVTLVRPQEVRQFLSPLDVSKIPGVGKVSQKILLDKFGVKLISDLGKIRVEDLKERFGKTAIWLLKVAEGIDESEVVENWDPVSLSGETTFEQDEQDYAKVREAMLEVARDVYRRATSEGCLFRNVGIKIRFTGFETRTRAKSLSAYTDSREILERETEKMLSEFYESKKKVRLVGVRVSSLRKTERTQSTLLDWES
ncbi:MAG: DNA polymerase IV, partial [Rhabdochlamydiaceae bacterium]